jgi:uncharacterized protein
MGFFRGAVAVSHQRWGPDARIRRRHFLLDDGGADLPSLFEMEFRFSGTRYQYGFEADDRHFLKEWLYAYPGRRRQTWFERDATGEDGVEWYFGKSLTGQNRVIADLTRPNSLFLSAAAANKHGRLTPVHHWLTRSLRFAHPDNYSDRLHFTLEEVERRNELAEDLRGLLRFADLGVCGFRVTRPEIDDDMRGRIFEAAKILATTSRGDDTGSRDSATDDPTDHDGVLEEVFVHLTQIELEHRREDGTTVRLPFSSESTGTKSLVAMAGPIFQCLRDGCVLLVDEIDTSLHPSLVAHLIRIFQDPVLNRRQAQLIFTSHDTSLLGNVLSDKPVLERDQVWFVQKDQGGASRSYPLTEFRPRKLENLERGYLQGRYGAAPFLDDALLTVHGSGQEPE